MAVADVVVAIVIVILFGYCVSTKTVSQCVYGAMLV